VTQQVHDLSELELLALSKVSCPKGVRNKLGPCTQIPFDFTVRVHGHVTIEPDYKKRPSTSIPYLVVMALLLKRLPNVSRDKAAAMVLECLREALTMDKSTRDTILENYPELTDSESAVQALLDDLPKTSSKGGVIPHLNIDGIPVDVDVAA
jgi:hypothetical protein